jgi:predicted glutamine amidotransferase
VTPVDGFGVGWYVPEVSREPAVVRFTRAPWHDANLRNLAAVSNSPCVISHARVASAGMPASEANCHPFRHERILFAHSGRVGGFSRVRRAFLESLSDEAFAMLSGSTDSELIFGVFLDLLWARQEVDAHMRLAGALNEMAWRIVATLQDRAPGEGVRLNVALSDGEHIVACRFSWNEEHLPDPLYYVGRQVFDPIHPPPPARRARERSVVTTISSEPLTDDSDWVSIPPGQLIIADREVEPLHFAMRPRGLVPASR